MSFCKKIRKKQKKRLFYSFCSNQMLVVLMDCVQPGEGSEHYTPLVGISATADAECSQLRAFGHKERELDT